MANAERGNEAIGFFSDDGKPWKRAQAPIDALMGAKLNKYLGRVTEGWFIAGHTRLGTRGGNIRENAHPFRYGNYIGSHNGVVGAPTEYAVDSMYLIDLLSKNDGNYNVALDDVSGYWGLTWFDGSSFFVQTHRQELAVTQIGDVYYYSSDKRHLKAVLGDCAMHEFSEGETMRFTPDGDKGVIVTKMPCLVHKPEKWVGYNPRTQGGFSGSYAAVTGRSQYGYDEDAGGRSYVQTPGRTWVPVDSEADLDKEYSAIVAGKGDDVPDYDERWREVWAEYAIDDEENFKAESYAG